MKVVVDAQGYITFRIYHCSSYVLTDELIEEAAGNYGLAALDVYSLEAVAVVTETPTTEPTIVPSDTPVIEPDEESLDTGSSSLSLKNGISPLIYFISLAGVALISIALTLIIVKSRKKEKHKVKKKKEEEK